MFLQTFEPNPIAITFGLLTIRWYGLCMVAAILVGLFIVRRLARQNKLPVSAVLDVAFYAIIFGLLGARIYAVLLEWEYFSIHPEQIVAIWRGGLAIHGAIIGGLLTVIIFCKRRGYQLWQWLDMLAVAVPLGQAIGRWGNYFNQELFGKPTTAPWAITINPEHRPLGYGQYQFFHPTFLYESILNLINFLFLYILYRHRDRLGLKTGSIFFIYLINYALVRIFMEQFRIDHTPLLYGVRAPIIVSGVLLVAGVVGIVILQSNRLIKNNNA